MRTKEITKLIFITFMLVFTGSLKAQTKFSPYKSDVIIYSGYSFPIFPESDEWKNADRSQRTDMLQIPTDTLGSISTRRLLETCLYYPFNINAFLCDNQSEGFDKVKNGFNGYAELYQRNDFVAELIALYSSRDVNLVEKMDNDYDRGQYSFDYKIMELMILDILNSTTTTSQRSNQIVDIVSRKQSQREQMKEYYSKNGTTEIIVNFEL